MVGGGDWGCDSRWMRDCSCDDSLTGKGSLLLRPLRLRSSCHARPLPRARVKPREDRDINVKRRILNFFAGLSLALCVTTAAVWMYSIFRYEELIWQFSHLGAGVLASGNEMCLVGVCSDMPSPLDRQGLNRGWANDVRNLPDEFPHFAGAWGVGVIYESHGPLHFAGIVSPTWVVVLVFGVMPALWVRCHRSQLRPLWQAFRERSPINVLALVLLLPGMLTAVLWIVGEAGIMPSPQHMHGQWSYRACHTWPGAISLLVYHDTPVPLVGPPFPPNLAYTPAILTWYDKTIPVDVYHGSFGFACNFEPHVEINSTRSWVLLGQTIELRLPIWAAMALWLPLASPLMKWRNRRHRRKTWVVYELRLRSSGHARPLPRMRDGQAKSRYEFVR
jgi:hypothetical protein